MGAGIEPGEAAAQDLDRQLAARQIGAVDVGDLELAARRRLEACGDAHHIVVVEIEAGHRDVGARPLRFLLDRQRAAGTVELDYAVSLRRVNRVAEDGGAGLPRRRARERLREPVAVKQIVAQDQRHPVAADEIGADDKGVGKPARLALHREGELKTPVRAVAECRRWNNGWSAGVVMIRSSRMPANIRVDGG